MRSNTCRAAVHFLLSDLAETCFFAFNQVTFDGKLSFRIIGGEKLKLLNEGLSVISIFVRKLQKIG